MLAKIKFGYKKEGFTPSDSRSRADSMSIPSVKSKKNGPYLMVAVKCYQVTLSAVKPQFRTESLVRMTDKI